MTAQEYASIYENGGYQRTLRCLKRRGAAHDQAENVAQSAWLRGWARLPQLRDRRRLRGWVAVIAINQLRTAQRTRRFEQLQVEHERAGAFSVDVAGIDVRRAMEKCCGPRQKKLLNLIYFEGFSSAEAAAELGMSVASVHQELTRARSAIRSVLAAPRQEFTARKGGFANEVS